MVHVLFNQFTPVMHVVCIYWCRIASGECSIHIIAMYTRTKLNTMSFNNTVLIFNSFVYRRDHDNI